MEKKETNNYVNIEGNDRIRQKKIIAVPVEIHDEFYINPLTYYDFISEYRELIDKWSI